MHLVHKPTLHTPESPPADGRERYDDSIKYMDKQVGGIGARLPDGVKIDGRSLAPQLRGEKGMPRDWAYVQLGPRWFVREAGYKMNEKGELFDMSDAPFVEKPIALAEDTEPSKAARARLT